MMMMMMMMMSMSLLMVMRRCNFLCRSYHKSGETGCSDGAFVNTGATAIRIISADRTHTRLWVLGFREYGDYILPIKSPLPPKKHAHTQHISTELLLLFIKHPKSLTSKTHKDSKALSRAAWISASSPSSAASSKPHPGSSAGNERAAIISSHNNSNKIVE